MAAAGMVGGVALVAFAAFWYIVRRLISALEVLQNERDALRTATIDEVLKVWAEATLTEYNRSRDIPPVPRMPDAMIPHTGVDLDETELI